MRSRLLVLMVLIGCDDAATAGDAAVSADAYEPNPCSNPGVVTMPACVTDGLSNMAGAWVMSGTNVNFHGTSRGSIMLDLQFTPTAQPSCMDVVGSAVSPPTTTWPDPNGVWYVDSTVASFRKNFGSPEQGALAVAWDACVDATSGTLRVYARSGYNGFHTAFERMEEVTGTLAR